MGEKAVCDYPGCGEVGEIISRLSPEGYLVATGKKGILIQRSLPSLPLLRQTSR